MIILSAKVTIFFELSRLFDVFVFMSFITIVFGTAYYGINEC